MNLGAIILALLNDSEKHRDIGPKLSENEIERIEKAINLVLPNSYKLFLKEFGDGAFWVYSQGIDTVSVNPCWLNSFRKDLGETIIVEGGKKVKVETLLCLMCEDSNGGAWCWLTEEAHEDGEWPLAYYSINDSQLHYKVENFTKWLQVLHDSKGEVISTLDVDYKLGLG